MAATLTENLRLLNRKERHFLVGEALGNTRFRLHDSFRSRVGAAFGIEIPASAFAGMDYHLNWLYAALVLTYEPDKDNLYDNGADYVQGNQEDIDLLVVWEEGLKAHVVMLEAKGVIPFSNEQLESKFERLRLMFGMDECHWRNVHPHFGLVSPRKPSRLRENGAPKWAKKDVGEMVADNDYFHWVELRNLKRRRPCLKMVTRCNNKGKPSATGDFWTVAKG